MGLNERKAPPISFVARMGTEKCPCKGCEVRSEGCHGKCEAYGKWKESHEEMRNEYLKTIRIANEAKDHYREAVNKAVGNRHRRRTK